jgi:hypothetical protein
MWIEGVCEQSAEGNIRKERSDSRNMNVETERTAKWRDTVMVFFNTLFHYLA